MDSTPPLREMHKIAALVCVLVLAGCPSAPSDPPSAGSGTPPAAPPAERSATPASGEQPASMPTSMPTEASAAAGHDHAGHDHAGHDHGTVAADPAGLLGPDGRPRALNPGETGHYGAPFTIAGEPMSLASAIETCADSGQACKVTGTIERVCQRAGCWFTLAAPDVPRSVRVQMLNYGFFVPRNTPGATVVLEGTLARTTLTQEQAQHYADDEAAARNTPPEVVTGPVDVFEFTIAAADITLPVQ
ncbi:MAG: DUF4920 domain-containing protein [Myxococcales bacterium]|nr:DUF4920 domain-containing protein [Myxococcales bacterium]